MRVVHRFLQNMLADQHGDILIFGTFNPGILIGDDNVTDDCFITAYPHVGIFYGRDGHNHFWHLLPNVFNHPSLKRNNNVDVPSQQLNVLKQGFLNNNRVVLCDIIAEVQNITLENLKGFADANLEKGNIIPFDVIRKLQTTNPRYVFTTFSRNNGTPQINSIYDQIANYCQQNGIYFHPLPSPSGNTLRREGITLPELTERWRRIFEQAGVFADQAAQL